MGQRVFKMSQRLGEPEEIGDIVKKVAHVERRVHVDRRTLVFLGVLAGSFIAAIALSQAMRFQYEQGRAAGVAEISSSVASLEPFRLSERARIVYQCGRVDG